MTEHPRSKSTGGFCRLDWSPCINTDLNYIHSLALNSTKISGDIFLNFYLATLVDTLTCLVFMVTLDRFGRKWNLVCALALLGTCCLVLAFLPKRHHAALLGCHSIDI